MVRQFHWLWTALLLVSCGLSAEPDAITSQSDALAAPVPGRDDRAQAEAYWQTMLKNFEAQFAVQSHQIQQHVSMQWKLASLPLRGTSKAIPWSQSYWSYTSGGVQRRLATGQSQYPILTKTQVLAMSSSDLVNLSPTEKYDILHNLLRDDPNDPEHFLTTKRVREYVKSENAKGFELGGFCHGWGPLSITLREPGAFRTNSLPHLPGVELSMTSADIAALLSLNMHFTQDWALQQDRYAQVGRRCAAAANSKGSAKPLKSAAGCMSINAGVFHVLVTNQLGRLGIPVLADTRPDYVVLNEPLYSYSVQEDPKLAQSAFDGPIAPGTVASKYFRMTATYAVSPYDAVPNGGARIKKVRTHIYRVELDANGEVIGGSWLRSANSQRPDFVWTLALTPESASLPGIYDIYRKSIGVSASPSP
jgi:hypothetical protein